MKVRAMKTVRVVILATIGALAAQGCMSGTETDNPGDGLVGFGNSGCKKEAAMSVVPGKSAEAFVAASEFDGLFCVEWERRSGDELALRFLNVPGACSVPWKGSAARNGEGGLDLLAANPGCTITRCGNCLYDLTFEVPDADPAGLDVGLGLVSCAGNAPVVVAQLTLPEDAGDSGILCRYGERGAVTQHAQTTNACGSRFTPCDSTAGNCEGGVICAGELACTEVDATSGDELCLAACETDDDCAPAGVTTCAGGVCQVPAGF